MHESVLPVSEKIKISQKVKNLRIQNKILANVRDDKNRSRMSIRPQTAAGFQNLKILVW